MREHTSTKHNPVIPLCSCVSFVVMAFLVLGCMGGGPPTHPSWKNATGAEQYERLMWQSIRDKDWKEVEYRLAPTFVGVTANGQALDRTAWLAYWKSEPIKDFSLGEVSVQPQGADMTVSYVFHSSGAPGAAAAGGLRVVSVWQQVKRGWILTTTAMTPIAPIQSSSLANRRPVVGTFVISTENSLNR
ncbi:MAG TPA: nuclear transport factor 2 family protein [Candidatus Angelobacter sp.]|nr:nuclear transport factor 2 family protein [Candidatus Angelobacter sp.]